MATTQVLLGKSASNATGQPAIAATSYGGVGNGTVLFSSTAESRGTLVWPTAGTFANLLVTVSVAQSSGAGWTFTLRQNGIDTALVATLNGGTSARDTTHSVTVAAGDRLTLKAVPIGSPTVTSNWTTVAIDFTGAATGESGYAGQTTTAVVANTAARYQGVFRLNDSWAATAVTPAGAGSASSLAAAAGTLTALYVLLESAPGAGKTWIFAIYKNGVKQDGTGGTIDTRVTVTGAGVTTGSATFTLPVAPGDVFTLESLPSGTPTSTRIAAALRFVATTDGQSQFCGCTSGTPSATLPRWTRLASANAMPWQTPETGDNSLMVSGVSTFTLASFRLQVDTAPGAGHSHTYSVRKNAASPGGAPSVLIADTATSGVDGVGTISLSDGDTLTLQAVPAGTPTLSPQLWGCIQTFGAGASAVRADPYVWGPV